MLWLFAIVLGVVFGLVTGGRIGNLAGLRFRWPWLIIAAVVVRESVVLTPLGRVDGARYAYVLALAAIALGDHVEQLHQLLPARLALAQIDRHG